MVLCKLSSAILSSLNSHFLNLEASSPILLLLRPEINHGKPSYFLPVQAFGGGGVFLRDRGVKGPRGGGREEVDSSKGERPTHHWAGPRRAASRGAAGAGLEVAAVLRGLPTQLAAGHADGNKGTGQRRCKEDGGHETKAPVSCEASQAQPRREGEVSAAAGRPWERRLCLPSIRHVATQNTKLNHTIKKHRILG